MYHVTTDSGLNVTTPDALGAAEALGAELHQRIAEHPITWTIEVDGTCQEAGGINAHQGDPGHLQFIDETINDVTRRLAAATS